jgi:hypothetical protein
MRTPVRTFAQAIVAEAWRLLPARKTAAVIAQVCLADLGAVHGIYHPDSGLLELNERMFGGDRTHFIDDTGLERPLYGPAVSRALHTTLHEFAHAIGDRSRLWRSLSGWEEDPHDTPGTGRYVEARPGWTPGPSPWRYRAGTYFCRVYSAKSPLEDFADVVTHRALGWTHGFTHRGNGQAKLAYINRYVWDDRDAVVPFQRSSLTAHTHPEVSHVSQRLFRAYPRRQRAARRLRRTRA